MQDIWVIEVASWTLGQLGDTIYGIWRRVVPLGAMDLVSSTLMAHQVRPGPQYCFNSQLQ